MDSLNKSNLIKNEFEIVNNEIIKVNINPENTWSYYLQYKDTLDLTPGVINMFGYCRVSTQLQAQFGSSITTQIQLLFDECQRFQYDENNKRIKYNLVRTYIDDGISAKNITDRPGLVELKNYVTSLVTGRTHKKIGVMVSDLSRLTRSSEDLETLIKWITTEAIKLKFIDNSIDPETNSGKLMLSMMSAFFEFERKNSSYKTRLTLRSMSESGTLTGHCSYGWTSGIDDAGRKVNIPIPEEQIGLQEVIRISRSNPSLTPCQVMNIMNKTEISCLRGPGRNIRGSKITEKSAKRNDITKWTGKWTTQIIQKIIEHDRFEERQQIVKTQASGQGGQPTNIMKKDETVIKIIRDYLDETNGYDKDSYNYSEIARMIDNKYIFQKPINRNYVKQMMLASKIIKPEPVTKTIVDEVGIIEAIKSLIANEFIRTYKRLTEVLIERNVPLIGKRKNWNATNVRDLCLKYGIIV